MVELGLAIDGGKDLLGEGVLPNSRVFRQKKSGFPKMGPSFIQKSRISHKLPRMLCSYIALVYWWKGKVGVYIPYNGMKYKFHVMVNMYIYFQYNNGTHTEYTDMCELHSICFVSCVTTALVGIYLYTYMLLV